MKRMLIRLSVLSLVVVLGLIAIARAQRKTPADTGVESGESDATAAGATETTSETATGEQTTTKSDPFRAGRLQSAARAAAAREPSRFVADHGAKAISAVDDAKKAASDDSSTARTASAAESADASADSAESAPPPVDPFGLKNRKRSAPRQPTDSRRRRS